MSKKLKVGIIGLGGICKGAHMPGYKEMDNVEIVAVCDILPEKIEQLKDEEYKEIVDIIAISSEILSKIIKENLSEELPDYMKSVTLENFFDEHQTSATAIQSIQECWKTSSEMFNIYRKKILKMGISYGILSKVVK